MKNVACFLTLALIVGWLRLNNSFPLPVRQRREAPLAFLLVVTHMLCRERPRCYRRRTVRGAFSANQWCSLLQDP